MADAVALSVLRTKCRRLSNMETIDQANAFITDAELTERLNANLRTVYDLLVEARSAGFYRSVYSFSTVAGTQAYALPAAFMAILGARISPSTGQFYDLVDVTESEVTTYDPVTTGALPTRYQLRGANIALLPTPSSAFTVELAYLPAFVALVADGDTFDGVCGFEEAAVWRTVAEMLAKDQVDPSFALARAAEWDARIQKMAAARDVASPPRVERRYRKRWGVVGG